MKKGKSIPRLQYISQGSTETDQLAGIQRVLDAGIKWVQVRWKEADQSELSNLLEIVKPLCQSYDAYLCINDQVELAKEFEADALHLGLNDSPIAEARAILGSNTLIGGTANNFQYIKQRIEERVDYIGLGPLRFTSTKKSLSPILGYQGYEEIFENIRMQELSCPPIFAIGGVEWEDTDILQHLGLYGFAASNLFLKEPIPSELIL